MYAQLLLSNPQVKAAGALASTKSRLLTRSLQTMTTTPRQPSPFDTLDIRPVQRPDTAAYFMAKPRYADLLSAITTIVQSHKLPVYNKADYNKRGKWINRQVLEEKFGLKLNANEYSALRKKLEEADNLIISGAEEKETVGLYLNQFRKGYEHVEVVHVDKSGEVSGEKQAPEAKKKKTTWKRGAKDYLGRWRAAGKRKEAVALAWLVPVEGCENEGVPRVSKAKQRAIDEAIARKKAKALAEAEAEAEGQAEPKIEEAKAEETIKAEEIKAEETTKAENTEEAVPQETNPEETAEAANATKSKKSKPGAPVLAQPKALSFIPTGEVIINSKPLAEYFINSTDRQSVLFPFHVVNKTGRFNVFVRVRGGGHTGQAEACQLAISRALYAMDRLNHRAIHDAGLLNTDGRRVERKKTGKPKARKSYTWVKR
ncbi:37S ribosomal protein S9, mitochondrial [Coemansia sp. Benny D115]|nr:37S ribosomal protein S9, mitochondrial [Coemansia sp. Benny D115]